MDVWPENTSAVGALGVVALPVVTVIVTLAVVEQVPLVAVTV